MTSPPILTAVISTIVREHWSEWDDYRVSILFKYQQNKRSCRFVGANPTVVKQEKTTLTKLKAEARMKFKYKLKSKWVVAVVIALLSLGLFSGNSTQPNAS